MNVSVFTPVGGSTLLRNSGLRRLNRRATTGSLDRLIRTAPAAEARGRKWRQAHRTHVLLVDALIIVLVVATAQLARYTLLPPDDPSQRSSWQQATLLSIALVVSWLIALELQRSRDISLVGIGAEEYRRVVAATMWVFGLAAVVSLLFKIPISRGYLAISLGLGLVGLVVGRRIIRMLLERRRIRDEYITRVVVLGQPDSVNLLCESFKRSTAAGYRIVGACVPDFAGEVGDELVMAGGVVPVLGDDHTVEAALSLTGADVLAVAPVERLGHKKMQKLLWRLEALGVDLIVMPGLADVTGPRLRARPIDNLPLFHVASPRKDGPSAVAKRSFDLALGAAALMAALPVMLLAALAIKLDDGGPVLFRQVRVGQHGQEFRIFKFRTMMVDAEAAKHVEVARLGGPQIFYKSASDSRITRVGNFLRKTSIDELPQLLNVMQGAMSIVGPRPLVPGEGVTVEDFVERRELMKPGITGLWQVSGRSDLSEDERIRLDHSYVDNWSCVMDLVIVWRTVRAVLKREGAC